MIVEALQLIVSTAFPGQNLGITHEPIAAAEARLGIALPEPLKDLYSVAGGSRDLLNADYRFLPPDKLRVDDDHLIFCGENQGLESFGVSLEPLRAGRPNPPVQVRTEKNPKWFGESGKLSAFLLGMAAWNVVLALPEKSRCPFPENDLPKLLPRFEPVGDPKVRLGSHYFGLVDRTHSIVAAYVHTSQMLYVGSPLEDVLDDLEQQLGLDLDSL